MTKSNVSGNSPMEASKVTLESRLATPDRLGNEAGGQERPGEARPAAPSNNAAEQSPVVKAPVLVVGPAPTPPAAGKRSSPPPAHPTTPSVANKDNRPSPPATALHQMDHFLRIKQIVKNAIAARHTFMICGRARVIRECLLTRGWCEKFQRKSVASAASDQQLSVDSNPSALLSGIGSLNDRQNERLLISKMLATHTVDFLWNAGSEWAGWPSQDNKTTIFNRFTRANFTSKVGLCSNVRQMHWYYEAGIANTLFPRCYNISQSDQLHAFIDDFRMTACLSLLKWIVDKMRDEGEESVRASNGIIPLKALDFAISRCSDFIGSQAHEDIDQELEKVWSHQWEQFITWYYKLVHGHALFITNSIPIQKYLVTAQSLLKKVKKYWPQLDMDGTLNVWILKPGNKSRGRGIVLMNKLDDILAKVNPTNKTTDTRFVIQKYIERPLLIYDTKFDIRQWFIVTNAQPLTLWMYRESYLRFCSQKFSLTNFHESVHLSNNAVQCKYKNSPDRDPALPSDNMWDIAAFKEYLRKRGHENAWEEMIYPGIKQGLVGSLLASQEAMDQRKNSFELYGADFMVMEDLTVWLIEINSHPDMSNSTSVTTRLCRKAMEDTVKVVIDHRENPNADTGDFELIYKQKLSSCQGYLGSGLSLQGTRISVNLGDKRISTGGGNNSAAVDSYKKRKGLPSAALAQQPLHVGPVLVDLIEELELQLDNEFYEYLKLRTSSGVARQIPALREVDDGAAAASTQPEPSQRFTVETNTVSKSVNLAESGSQTALKPLANSTPGTQRSNTTKSTRTGKNSSSKKSSRYKAKLAQARDTDSATIKPLTAKNLVTKIMNLQKESSKSKSASLRSNPKLYRISQATKNVVLSSDLPTSAEGTLDKNQKAEQKIVPTPSNEALAASKEDNAKAGRSRRPSTEKTNQVPINVSDMYAVGLAVNK